MLGAVPQTLGTANDSEIFRIYGLDLLGPLPGMSQIWHGSNGSGLTAYLSRTPCHKDFNKMSGWTRNKFHESHKTSSKLKKLSVHITIGIGLFWGAFPYWPTLGRCHLPRIIHPRKQNLSPENGWLEDEHSGVSENSGTPKSSILIGFSIINYPFWGTTIFGNTHSFWDGLFFGGGDDTFGDDVAPMSQPWFLTGRQTTGKQQRRALPPLLVDLILWSLLLFFQQLFTPFVKL